MIKKIKFLWLLFLVGGCDLPGNLTNFFNDNMERLKECHFEHEAVERFSREIKSIIESPNLGTIKFGGLDNTAEGFILHLHENVVRLFSMLPSNHPERPAICSIMVDLQLACAKIKEERERAQPPVDQPRFFVPFNFKRGAFESLTEYFDRLIRKIQEDRFAHDTLKKAHIEIMLLNARVTLGNIEFGGSTNGYEGFRDHLCEPISVPQDLNDEQNIFLSEIIEFFQSIAERLNGAQRFQRNPRAPRRVGRFN